MIAPQGLLPLPLPLSMRCRLVLNELWGSHALSSVGGPMRGDLFTGDNYLLTWLMSQVTILVEARQRLTPACTIYRSTKKC